MHKLAITLGAGALFARFAGSANAMPLADDQPTETGITKVAGGCGPLAHPTPWGCRPNVPGLGLVIPQPHRDDEWRRERWRREHRRDWRHRHQDDDGDY